MPVNGWKHSINTLSATGTDKFPKKFLTKRIQKGIIIQIGDSTALRGVVIIALQQSWAKVS